MADIQQNPDETPDVAATEVVAETAEAPVEASAEAVAVEAEVIEAAPVVALEESPVAETPAEAVTEAVATAEDSAAVDTVAEGVAEVAPETAEPVEAVADAMAEPVEAAADVVAEAPEVLVVEDPVVAPVVDARALKQQAGMIGYTGEISGQVVRLEDLARAEAGLFKTEQYDRLKEMMEETFTNVTEQQIVSGRIVSIGEKDVVIDIGFKSDGIVPKNEFSGELHAGDRVDVFLERIEDGQGQLVLSKTKADTFRRWRRIEEAFQNEEVLEGTVVRRIKGGMIVELFDGIEAFLPGSQIDVRPVRDFDAYLDKRMQFKIVKINEANENLVVSHKALIERDLQDQRQKILSTMEPGQILEGTVKNITDFGVFIDLGGVDGLLHITDLSWGRVSHPSELVHLDQKLNVVVLDYDKDRQRISLGLKQLQPHPWESIQEKYKPTDMVSGKVVSITDYGAFVELEKGIEGLVHISEMSWTEHIKHPSQIVSLGQIVDVKILNIDFDGKKISLGMKQLQPDPWSNIIERYPAGTVMRGRVRNITNFGVFVEIEPGIDGLVHISDLSWTKKIKHPSEIVKKGQELDVVVLNIDANERRISLGHKQVETNPWNQFAKVYAEGTDTEGKVVRIEDRGVVVELPLEVEGFVPQGELRNAGGRMREAYPEGTKLDLRVIRFDHNQKEIILSETAPVRAKERAEKDAVFAERKAERDRERREVEAFQKGNAGPTTLGELSGLAALKAKAEAEEAAAARQQDEE
jgi:small subunit ribosomal protein S1